jgi:hypothetical protein
MARGHAGREICLVENQARIEEWNEPMGNWVAESRTNDEEG